MDGTALTTGVAGRSSLFNATYNVNITSEQNEEAQKSRCICTTYVAQSRDRTASDVVGYSTQPQQGWSSSPLLRIKGPS